MLSSPYVQQLANLWAMRLVSARARQRAIMLPVAGGFNSDRGHCGRKFLSELQSERRCCCCSVGTRSRGSAGVVRLLASVTVCTGERAGSWAAGLRAGGRGGAAIEGGKGRRAGSRILERGERDRERRRRSEEGGRR